MKASDEITNQRFAEADSDTRFELLLGRLSRTGVKKAKKRARPRVIRGANGKIIARLTPSPKRPMLQFNENAHPGFATHLAQIMPLLVAEWADKSSFDGHI